MLIVCPECGFSRNVGKDRIKGRYIVATCPRCFCHFEVSATGETRDLSKCKNRTEKDRQNEEDDIRAIVHRSYEKEQHRLDNDPYEDAADDIDDEEYREYMAEYGVDPAKRVVNPWDTAPKALGWFTSFKLAVMTIMLVPASFFRLLNPAQTIYRALLFFVIICLFQIAVERFWIQGMLAFFGSTTVDDPQLKSLIEVLTPKTNFVLTLLLRTAVYILQIYVFSFLMYIALKLVASEKASFSLVFQILAYSSAPSLLCVIPALGSLIGALWSIGCIAVGLKTVFELDWGRVFFVFLPPLVIILPLISQLLTLFGR